MSKTLALHNQGRAGEHWFSSSEYSDKAIEAIRNADPRGGQTNMPPTSIPSPFAQMDLVLTAFNNATKANNLKSIKPIDFKLISDMLDVGEIFFRYNYLKQEPDKNLDIITWHKKTHIDKLVYGSNNRHNRLGEALNLYLNQDAKTYNFADMEEMYILRYNYRVIGATSPATLFVASPNDLSFVKLVMPNGDKLFDSGYMHLYERDEEYQKWFYGLRKAIPMFEAKFRAINDYMEICLKTLSQMPEKRALHEALYNLNVNYYDPASNQQLDNLTLGEDAHRAVLIGHTPLLCKAVEVLTKSIASDFVIESSIFQDIKPLALRPGHDGRARNGAPLNYYRSTYDNTIIVVKHEDPLPIEERFLPGITGVQYPYVTTSDFLEPYLIELPYPINKSKFYTVDIISSQSQRSYLLPIKPAYFKYFTVEDLMQNFSVKVLAGGMVRCELKIPIQKGEFITYDRNYLKGANPVELATPDVSQNKGVIVQHLVGLSIYPHIKIEAPSVSPDYRVLLVDRDVTEVTKKRRYTLSFHKFNGLSDVKAEHTDRIDKILNKDATNTTRIHVLNDNFDYISLNSGIASGLIIPKFETVQEGTINFRFAVDFGTTNTHIEYTKGDAEPEALNITEADLQVGTLHDMNFIKTDASVSGTSATEIFEVVRHVFPTFLGNNHEFSFPQRSVIMNRKGMKAAEVLSSYVFQDFNIPFTYGRYTINEKDFNHELATNLKWSKLEGIDEKRVDMFFENLLFMMRTKVLRNGGNLKNTKLTVFYPTSMEEYRKNSFKQKWKSLFKKYFDPITQDQVKLIHEGIAPFFYYKKKQSISASLKPAVCVDIGGGTTDILIFRAGEGTDFTEAPILHTSVKFAANNIFGNGLIHENRADKSDNGFVKRYESRMRNLVSSPALASSDVDFVGLFDQMISSQKPNDIIDFFFSLENNKQIKEKNINESFTKMLMNDEEIRLVFILFYVSLIYHIAQLMKLKSLDLPTYITFSGNGSKVLQLLGIEVKTLEAFTQTIFIKVYGINAYDKDGLTIKREELIPKALTCKGGLLLSEAEERKIDSIDEDALKTILLGKPITVPSTENLIQGVQRIPLTREHIDAVEKGFQDFIKFFCDELPDVYSFTKKFGIPPHLMAMCKEKLNERVKEAIQKGLEYRHGEIKADSNIEESMFFYPIIESLYRLANQINEIKQN